MDDDISNVLLEVTGVSVAFGGLDVLADVSFSVPTTGIVGLIGPNGAGKTTVFNVLCGFVRPDRGRLSFDGRPLRRQRPRELTGLGISRTLQGLGLFDGLTAVENVVAGQTHASRSSTLATLLATPWADRDERRLHATAIASLQSLGIADAADRACGSLPYGIRKRVALARALVSQPRLLLLDEPAAGLSGTEIAELSDLLRDLGSRTAILLVEHHMDFVMGICGQIVVLDFGHVIARGTPEQTRADPAVQRAYLGEPVDTSPATRAP